MGSRSVSTLWPALVTGAPGRRCCRTGSARAMVPICIQLGCLSQGGHWPTQTHSHTTQALPTPGQQHPARPRARRYQSSHHPTYIVDRRQRRGVQGKVGRGGRRQATFERAVAHITAVEQIGPPPPHVPQRRRGPDPPRTLLRQDHLPVAGLEAVGAAALPVAGAVGARGHRHQGPPQKPQDKVQPAVRHAPPPHVVFTPGVWRSTSRVPPGTDSRKIIWGYECAACARSAGGRAPSTAPTGWRW